MRSSVGAHTEVVLAPFLVDGYAAVSIVGHQLLQYLGSRFIMLH